MKVQLHFLSYVTLKMGLKNYPALLDLIFSTEKQGPKKNILAPRSDP